MLSTNKSFIVSRAQSSWKSTLGKILATIPHDPENRLREHLRKQGDLSHIVTEALDSYLDRTEKKGKKRTRWCSIHFWALEQVQNSFMRSFDLSRTL